MTTDKGDSLPLRCRLGFHRWRPKGRVKQAEASVCTRCGLDAWDADNGGPAS